MKATSLFASLMVSGVLMNHAAANGAFDGRRVFQRIEVSNAGSVGVSAASILYGDDEILAGPAVRSYAAGTGLRRTFSEGLVSGIPQRTRIRWVTEDGRSHEATIATGSLVRNLDVFYGFRFYFDNDHVDVYVIERVPGPSPRLNLKYTKVSPPGA